MIKKNFSKLIFICSQIVEGGFIDICVMMVAVPKQVFNRFVFWAAPVFKSKATFEAMNKFMDGRVI